MSKIVDFIKQVHKDYQVKYVLTNERVRDLKFRLAQADIVDSVSPDDEQLATNIILRDYGKAASTRRTASASAPSMGGQGSAAGVCPRCSSYMGYVMLASFKKSRYCPTCHVCVQVD